MKENKTVKEILERIDKEGKIRCCDFITSKMKPGLGKHSLPESERKRYSKIHHALTLLVGDNTLIKERNGMSVYYRRSDIV